jgi:hypothetical protein
MFLHLKVMDMCQCKYLPTQPSKSQWQLYEPPALAIVKCTSVLGAYLWVPYGSQNKKCLLILHSNNQIDFVMEACCLL